MLDDDTNDIERRETMQELSDVIALAQEMGRRLANETHGSAYAQVLALNEVLHQARGQLDKIQGKDSA